MPTRIRWFQMGPSDGSSSSFIACLRLPGWFTSMQSLRPAWWGWRRRWWWKCSNIITQYDTLWDKLLVSQVPQLPVATGLWNLTRLCLALPSLVVSYQVPYWALARQICVITLLTLGTFLPNSDSPSMPGKIWYCCVTLTHTQDLQPWLYIWPIVVPPCTC